MCRWCISSYKKNKGGLTMKKGKVVELRNTERRILVTHTDLDGVGCAVIYAKCFPQVEVYFAMPDDVNEVVMDVISNPHNEGIPVMISDLSVNEDVAAILNNRGKSELIDHHKTALGLTEKYQWALVDISLCATMLMYNVMSNMFNLSDYADFARMVDNYDRWGEGHGPCDKSADMSRLVWLLGQERFFKRFVAISSLKFSPVEESIIELDKERETKYIKESIDMVSINTDANGHQYGLLAADQYVSMLGSQLLKLIPQIEYVIMINFREDRAQLRSRGNVDVSELAKQMGGGGHRKAAGFPLKDTVVKTFLNCDPTKCEYIRQLEYQISEFEELVKGPVIDHHSGYIAGENPSEGTPVSMNMRGFHNGTKKEKISDGYQYKCSCGYKSYSWPQNDESIIYCPSCKKLYPAESDDRKIVGQKKV